jgi:hypothetical protein
LQRRHQFEAVHLGHHQVEQHLVEQLPPRPRRGRGGHSPPRESGVVGMNHVDPVGQSSSSVLFFVLGERPRSAAKKSRTLLCLSALPSHHR